MLSIILLCSFLIRIATATNFNVCQTVRCAAPDCPAGIIPPSPENGQCCSRCDCSAVSCVAVECEGSYVPVGECCPVCPTAAPPNPCELSPETGPCKAHRTRWYFDAQSSTCKTFTYGGCQGNDNNFLFEEECKSECGCTGVVCGLPICPNGELPVHLEDECCPSCPDPCHGLPVVDCFIDPCEVATCPGAPYATCKSNYCGSCNARFFIGDEDITDTCECPPDQPAVNCFIDPCEVATCPGVPSATCEANYCGGCNANFFVGTIDVTSLCNCPDVCSPEFCNVTSQESNAMKLCTLPDNTPREIPGCPGCDITSCAACYYSDDVLASPTECSSYSVQLHKTLGIPIESQIKKWGKCLSKLSQEYDESMEYRCWRPPVDCPFKG